MGIHEWSYDNDIRIDRRYRVPLKDKIVALRDIKREVELGFDEQLAYKEAERCLNCDVQTAFTGRSASNATRAWTSARWTASPSPRTARRRICGERLNAPAQESRPAALCLGPLKTGRVMVKDEDVCLHCGLCAERCPTGAWDMQRFFYRYGTSGTRDVGAARARQRLRRPLRERQRLGIGKRQPAVRPRPILRMGVPVAPRNIFPSNIQGLPTWYEVRVTRRASWARGAAPTSWSR